ncbi:hypothetical protein Tco_0743220 [Tanacetum coccineum]
MRRSKIVTKEVGQSERIDDDEVDSEETREDKEPLVRTRLSRIAIGGKAYQESEEEKVDHSKKLKGLETLGSSEGFGVTPEVPNELVFKSLNKGAGEPYDYSSSSSFDSEFGVEDISSNKAEVTEKANNAKIITVNDVLKDPVEPKVQSMVDIQVTQEKHAEPRPPLVDTTKSNKPDSQVESGELECRITRLEKKVHAMSSFNLLEAIDKFVKAHLKNVLPKDVPYYSKIKLEKAKKSMPKNSSTPVDQAALDEFEEKD